MQALVWLGPMQLRLEEVPEPAPAEGEVIVRSTAAGICGSEVEGYLGLQANRTPPLIMGHEMAGVVVALGGGVEASWLGRLVAVNPIISCRQCRHCASGDRNLCRRKGLVGIARPGGFAERLSVPTGNLLALPEGSDPRTGAFVEPMANGVHAARLGLQGRPGLTAVVIGAGAIGFCTLQALVALGAGRVDVVEPGAGRRELSLRAGAARALPDGAAARQVFGVTDGPRRDDAAGVDVVVDAVGTTATRQLALDLCRPQGRLVLLGLHDDESPVAFRPVVRDEISLTGSYAYSDEDFSRAAEMLLNGAAGPGEVEAVRPLADGPALFSSLAEHTIEPVRVFIGNGG